MFSKNYTVPLPPKIGYYTLGISPPNDCRKKELDEAKGKDMV